MTAKHDEPLDKHAKSAPQAVGPLTVKVKLLSVRTVKMDDGSHVNQAVGDEVEVPSYEAQRMIDAGHATKV